MMWCHNYHIWDAIRQVGPETFQNNRYNHVKMCDYANAYMDKIQLNCMFTNVYKCSDKMAKTILLIDHQSYILMTFINLLMFIIPGPWHSFVDNGLMVVSEQVPQT